MLVWRRGVRAEASVAKLPALSMLALAISLAGCASDEEYRREAMMRHQAAITSQQMREVELEEDGLPSQLPPPINRRREADDPSEPFSPNYGRTVNAPQRTTIAPEPHDVSLPSGRLAARSN